MSNNMSTDSLLMLIESVLIEALEPRQNRKRGDDLSSFEYLQVPDPSLEKRRMATKILEL